MRKQKIQRFIKLTMMFCLATSIALAGCSQPKSNSGSDLVNNTDSNSGSQLQSESANQNKDHLQQATTVTLYQSSAGLSDTEFRELFAEPVHKKYPHITMEMIREQQHPISELIAANSFPDIVFTSSLDLNKFLTVQLPLNLNDLIKENQFDIDRFEKRVLNEIRAYSESGSTFGIPIFVNFGATYYNEDILNKAGLPFPQDGVTWEELVDLSRQVAGKNNAVRTMGLEGIVRTATSLRLPLVDKTKEEARMTTDGWKYLFELHKSIHDIPDSKEVREGKHGFLEQNTAFLISYGARLGELEELYANNKSFNWNLTTYPLFGGVSSQGMETESQVIMISSMSKQQDLAFQILSFLTTDDELHSHAVKKGRVSAMKDDKYKTTFGAELKSLQGKNIAAIFKNQYADNAPITIYDNSVKQLMNDAIHRVKQGTDDINTALRVAEEEANRRISDMKKLAQ